jgi:hypothetical protein
MASKVHIQKTIAILIAAYPSADAKEKEAMAPFLRMVEQMMLPYPERVLSELVNSRIGIIATSKFFPSIAELKQFCDRLWDKLDPQVQVDRAPDPLMLGGPAKDPEVEAAQRACIIQGFKDLLAELKSVPDPLRPNQPPPKSKVEEKAEAEAWLERQAERAKTDPLPKLSESALKAFHNPLSGRTI